MAVNEVNSVAKELKRVRLEPNTDLVHVVEDVHADKVPRLIEREGEPLAVLLSPEDYTTVFARPKSKRRKRRLLSFAGVWVDLDADRMIEELYRARREAPPSAAAEL